MLPPQAKLLKHSCQPHAMQIDRGQLFLWAEKENITTQHCTQPVDLEDLCAAPEACEMVCDALNALGTSSGLQRHERLAAVRLISGLGDSSTPEVNR